MSMKYEQKVKEFICANRGEMIKLWETIVNMESSVLDKEGVDAVCAVLKKEMEDMGMTTRVMEHPNAGNMLIGEWNKQAGKSPIVFSGHMDTVFPKDAVHNKFHIEDGKATGAGVLDMKAGLVIALYIIKALQHVGFTEYPIKCIFAGDEENVHCNSNTKEEMEDEIRGALADFNFETGNIKDGIVVGRLGAQLFSIDIQGVAAHSGNDPLIGRNALQEAAEKIIRLQNLNDIPGGKLVNMAMIEAGNKENIIPGKCSMQGCLRFQSDKLFNELNAQMDEIVNTNYVDGTSSCIHRAGKIDCMERVSGNDQLFNFTKRIGEEIGYHGLHAIQVGGGSDASAATKVGVPAICGVGVKGEWNHTAKEYAVVESLFERCIWLTMVVTRFQEFQNR